MLGMLSRQKLQSPGKEKCSDMCYPQDFILAGHQALVWHSGLPWAVSNPFFENMDLTRVISVL